MGEPTIGQLVILAAFLLYCGLQGVAYFALGPNFPLH